MTKRNEDKIILIVEDVINKFLGYPKDNEHRKAFLTESDMKCYLYCCLNNAFNGKKFDFPHLATEFKLKNITGVTNDMLYASNYQHPRMDIAILTEGKPDSDGDWAEVPCVLYGIELKFSYSSGNFEKGIDSFKGQFERMQNLYNKDKLKSGICIWFENLYMNTDKRIEKIRAEIEKVKPRNIKCVYLEMGNEPHFFR
ncbi:MAG: hypothetical protein JW724_01470 [Candidatus Altiarchaeota archaeon]|nr:hypothetical protein [Candidatus Altiarchaeota archaeon]